MSDDFFLEIKDILGRAMSLPAGEREAFVRAQIEDPTKRDQALSYLGGESNSLPMPLLPLTDLLREYEAGLVLPGTQVGSFVVTEPLGQGGMARVYRGYDPELKRAVALKVLLPSAELVDERARVLREARNAAQVSHPNVATIYRIIEQDGRAFIVMEYLDGEDLAAVLRGARLSVTRALAIGRQLASALAAAHAAGVVHRDLKPGNIKVLRSGSVKVMDFGIAGLTGAYATISSTAPGTAPPEATRPPGQPGTPGYMAPEQYATPDFDERSDLFSLGIVLFEMVTGEPAYPDRRPDQLRAAVQRPIRRADLVNPQTPKTVADVIARATAVAPADRYASAVALEAALAEAERAVLVDDITRDRHLVPAPVQLWTWRRALRVTAPWVLPAIAVMWALGSLSTAVYDQILRREPAFRSEHWYSSLDYGRKSLLVPVLFMCAATALWWAGCFVVRLLRPVPGVSRAIDMVERIVDRISRALKLDDARSLAQAATALAVALLAGIFWAFGDLLRACMSNLSEAPSSRIALLAAGELGGPYRLSLLVVLLLLGTAALRVRRLHGSREPSNAMALAPLIGALLVAVLLLQLPYRLLWNRHAPKVDVGGEGCYLIGQSPDGAQVFCPARERDRTQRVSLADPSVKVLNTRGDIFAFWTPG